MNIFEFLHYPKDHRKENKVTQLVKHFDEVSDKHKDKELVGQVKKDGVCALVVVKSDGIRIFSRTGKPFANVECLRTSLYELELPFGVYMGEMCCNLVSLEVLSGVVNPNRVNPLKEEVWRVPKNLTLHLFDFLSIGNFLDGACSLPYTSRHGDLKNKVGRGNSHIEVLPYGLLGEDETDFVTDYYIDLGEEGAIFRDPEAGWEAGHKGWRAMKKVRGVDYDLRCIGVEEGTGKYAGKVANLIFQWKDDLTIKAMLGKGWTHQMAKDMYWDMSTPNTPIGKIFQVYALEESSKGKLRLPKVGELRFDKGQPDI